MPETSAIFHILPLGWEHAGWRGVFYPKDLPVAWRLGYFANEFPAVAVPQAAWLQAHQDRFRAWLDEVGSQFRFYLVLERPLTPAIIGETREWLADALGGFVAPPEVTRPGRSPGAFYRRIGVVEEGPQGGCLACGVSLNGMDLQAQRALLERLSGRVEVDAELLLIVEDRPPEIASLAGLRQLAELMGLA